jgi:hypothetical protein
MKLIMYAGQKNFQVLLTYWKKLLFCSFSRTINMTEQNQSKYFCTFSIKCKDCYVKKRGADKYERGTAQGVSYKLSENLHESQRTIGHPG